MTITHSPEIESYLKLPDDSRTILEIMAVYATPLSTTQLMGLIEKTGGLSKGRRTTDRILAQQLRLLFGKKMITSSTYRTECNPSFADAILHYLDDEKRLGKIADVVLTMNLKQDFRYYMYNDSPIAVALRRARLLVRTGEIEEMWRQIETAESLIEPGSLHFSEMILRVCSYPFDHRLKARLDDFNLGFLLHVYVYACFQKLLSPGDVLEELATLIQKEPRYPTKLWLRTNFFRSLRGQTDLENPEDPGRFGAIIPAVQHYLQGNFTEAEKCFPDQISKDQPPLLPLQGVFHLATCTHLGKKKRAQSLTDIYGCFDSCTHEFFLILDVYKGKSIPLMYDKDLRSAFDNEETLPEVFLYKALLAFWGIYGNLGDLTVEIQKYHQRAHDAGWLWYAGELAAILNVLGLAPPHAGLPAVPMTQLLKVPAPWQQSLDSLWELVDEKPTVADKENRLVWFIGLRNWKIELVARLQKRKKSGGWSSGRKLPIQKIQHEIGDDLSKQDEEICQFLSRTHMYGYYRQSDEEYNMIQALDHMVGHPLLFSDDRPDTTVTLEHGKAELKVEKKADGFGVTMVPSYPGNAAYCILKKGENRLILYTLDKSQQEIAKLLYKGLYVPGEGKEKVRAMLGHLSTLIQVDTESPLTSDLQAKQGEVKPYLQLAPYGDGLRAQVIMRPFGPQGPAWRPGSGSNMVSAEVAGERCLVRRELDAEKAAVETLLETCPVLSVQERTDWEWFLPDATESLELLYQAKQSEEIVSLEWPEGEERTVSHSANNLRVKLEKKQDWFAVKGELVVDGETVLSLKNLLKLSEKAVGRFVPLGQGRFLALTREMCRKLEELDAYSEPDKAGLRFHASRVAALEGTLEDLDMEDENQNWMELKARLRDAETIDPKVPKTLQADLRDYQRDGFRWLCSLASWGAGACLADDMGLGKTIQALAVLLARAEQGPALVVAPTSVCANWVSEAFRFAPSLNVLSANEDRVKALASPGPFDLVICSYGLLPRLVDQLASIHWTTLILDEAQAIKNAGTHRSKAAQRLDSDFRIALTGTPIENHLGELWNLLRFLNPGLMGSWQSFSKKFGVPIERYHDTAARNRLKKLVQPFILRRLKSQVLQELPPRTEVLVRVTLSDEERAFYESVRQTAVERLEGVDGDPNPHLRILAEITRMRQACCHPRLLLPQTKLSGCKLAHFGEMVDELADNNHRALVFSQFTSHLAILREFLDKKGIAYQYLDGSTPMGKRAEAVKAFQQGSDLLFLISLKAGGTGLNLTGADYVIHMDPWWNPAVEDQASDRAHRIGQTRPVTIYRLVAENTIEEKIAAMHTKKRALAEDLLSGSDLAGKMSARELLTLVREG